MSGGPTLIRAQSLAALPKRAGAAPPLPVSPAPSPGASAQHELADEHGGEEVDRLASSGAAASAPAARDGVARRDSAAGVHGAAGLRSRFNSTSFVVSAPALSVALPPRGQNMSVESCLAGLLQGGVRDTTEARRLGGLRRTRTAADRRSTALAFLKGIQIDRRAVDASRSSAALGPASAAHGAASGLGGLSGDMLGASSLARIVRLHAPRLADDLHHAALSLRTLRTLVSFEVLAEALAHARLQLVLSFAAGATHSGATTPRVTGAAPAASPSSASPTAAGTRPGASGGPRLFGHPIAVFSVIARFTEQSSGAAVAASESVVEPVSALLLRQRRTLSHQHLLGSVWASNKASGSGPTAAPKRLDDAASHGKERVIYRLPSFTVSVLPYVSPEALSEHLNVQFQARYPYLHESLTLSRIHALKKAMLAIALRVGLELATLAFAFHYLERLVVKNAIENANALPLFGACTLSLAEKYNGRLSTQENAYSELGQAVEAVLLVPHLAQRRAEFRVMALLDFELHVAPVDVLPHYERILHVRGLTVDELGLPEAQLRLYRAVQSAGAGDTDLLGLDVSSDLE